MPDLSDLTQNQRDLLLSILTAVQEAGLKARYATFQAEFWLTTPEITELQAVLRKLSRP